MRQYIGRSYTGQWGPQTGASLAGASASLSQSPPPYSLEDSSTVFNLETVHVCVSVCTYLCSSLADEPETEW